MSSDVARQCTPAERANAATRQRADVCRNKSRKGKGVFQPFLKGYLPDVVAVETSQRIFAAAAQTGMGLCFLPVHYQYGGCDGRGLAAGQIRFGTSIEQFQRLHDGARGGLASAAADTGIGVAPHSLRAVGIADMRTYNAAFPEGPIHMHLAEQCAEVAEVEQAWGARPVTWALDNMGLDARWCLIHCTQMTPDETLALSGSGAVAGLYPITESSLGDGIFDAVRWADAGGAYAIGSDSNIRISLSEELRTLDYSQRLRDGTRAALASGQKSTGRHMVQNGQHSGRAQIVAAYKRTTDDLKDAI